MFLQTSQAQKLLAEFLGTAFLVAAVVGSGIMAARLAGGNDALALLCNTLPTGAILIVLIIVFGGISGAHFNPAVTAAFLLRKEIAVNEGALYILAQIAGGIAGTFAAHLMFDEALFQLSEKVRSGAAQWFSEFIAAFGLLMTIFGTLRWRRESVPFTVGLYITSAYWFTASTSFANPAVTIARALSDTFAGIRPFDVPAFIAAQLLGAGVAVFLARFLFAQHVAADISVRASPTAAE
ncbi:MAG: MIP/aquaporin family protein [Hyphomicrobiales bacterium]|nr:MIP/aquaporin family protein [Hyphomicrobiales bacterium]